MSITGSRAFFAILFVLLAAVSAYPSGPGSLDLTFAGAGYKIDSFGDGSYIAFGGDVAVQPDGKIVIVGYWIGAFVLARYNPDGALDTSFGVGGKVFTAFPLASSAPYDLMLQPDGKIVVVGKDGSDFNGRIVMARYNPDGSLDTSFGSNGKVTTGVFNGGPCGATAGAIQPDGKIVIAGYAYNSSQMKYYFAVARYNTNGSLDTSFDGDGITTTAALDALWASSVVIQPDGKIVAGGSTGSTGGPSDKFILTRYNPNGSVDTTFDGDGIVTTQMLQTGSVVVSIALLADGRIVAGGSTNSHFGVVRYNPDGSLDTSFDGDGKVITSVLSGSDSLYDIAVQADGRVVAAGYADNGSNNDLPLVRYNTDGSLDSSYGSGGKAVFDLGFNDRIGGMTLDAAGKAVIVGTSNNLLIGRITADFAPLVDVGGRVTSTNGQGIAGAAVVLTDENHNSRSAITNPFGYYGFSGISSNEIYTVRVSSKRYRFQPSSQTITLTVAVGNVDFVGNPGSESKVAEPETKISSGVEKDIVKLMRQKEK
jgi:uncharacterized delta-60 repeat protein